MNEDAEIIDRLLAGEIRDDEWPALRARLREDAGLRARLGAHAALEGMLGVALEDELTTTRRHRQWMEAVERADREAFVGAVERKIRRGSLARWFQAVAVLALLVGSAWFFLRPAPLGQVVRLEGVGWDGPPAWVEGGQLRRGDRLRIDMGLVELDLASRAAMIVEGPADLELAGPMRAILHRGRIVMRVTEAGHGYRVETPRGAVVDLGTEFGISVGENGVETHVLEGEVEAFPENGDKVLLKKDDALRFEDGGTAERMAADGGFFYTRLPPRRQSRPQWIHWRMEGTGPEGSDAPEVRGFAPMDSVLRPGVLEQGAPPAAVPGIFGMGQAFDGKGGYLESAFPGIGGQEPRTVCFWVKVPADFSTREGFGIVSWGEFLQPESGCVWQISINPLEADGPIGRIRVGAHGGQIVGSTDLRDDQWHHVAVVLYPASRPDIGRHVLVYLNGNPEPISRRALVALDTRIEAGGHGVWVGRNVAYGSDGPSRHGGFFRGAVDELFIFDSALTQQEIRDLQQRNLPPP